MSVDRQPDRTVAFVCDGCADGVFVSAETSFVEAWENARSEGWIVREVEGRFEHFCDCCKVPA